MNNPDLQTLAAVVTIVGGLIGLILGPLHIVDTILDIRKKIIEIPKRHKGK